MTSAANSSVPVQTNAQRGNSKTTPAKRSAEGTRKQPSRGAAKATTVADEDDDEDFDDEDAAEAEDDDDGEDFEGEDDDESEAKKKQREGGRVRFHPDPLNPFRT